MKGKQDEAGFAAVFGTWRGEGMMEVDYVTYNWWELTGRKEVP